MNEVACDYQWDVSRELTDDTLNDLVEKNTVYVTPYVQFKPALENTSNCDYFGSDLNFANYFGQSDFLVVSELLSHELCPYTKEHFPEIAPKRSYGPFQVLVLGTRVRVLDLRFEHPKVILQKFIETKEIVSNSEAAIDYSNISPENDHYLDTPLARGHQKIASEMANEIEGAILCNW
jgi:hypothetical protein